MTERACGCAFTTSHIYGCPTGGGRINSPMTLHEDWHKAHPGYPCEYNTCPQGQRLDLENATYTAAEVKVLTETATRLGRELGRREAFGEMAEAFEGLIPFLALDSPTADAVTQTAQNFRNLASPASGAASDATSVPSEGPGTSEPSKAAKTPQEPS